MTIHSILKMGDPRLLEASQPVDDLSAPQLKTLIDDMFETMHAASGAGLAAPQIGVPLRLVIFGYSDPEARNPRYPDADPVPQTVLINPVLTALDRRDVRLLDKAGTPLPVELPLAEDTARAMVVLEISLSGFSPGDYQIELTAGAGGVTEKHLLPIRIK